MKITSTLLNDPQGIDNLRPHMCAYRVAAVSYTHLGNLESTHTTSFSPYAVVQELSILSDIADKSS